jgi:hypothetical protein
MRTTLTIDDELARLLKQRALESGRTFKDVVNEALRAGLEQTGTTPSRRPYRLKPFGMGRPARGIDLDKALQLAGNLEGEKLVRPR